MSLVSASFSGSGRELPKMGHESTNNSSLEGKRSISQSLTPEVGASRSNYGADETATRAIHGPEGEQTKQHTLSSKSEKFMADRVKEMSQVDSPHLRELALMLGNMLNIETPIYEPERSHPPSHLKIDIGDRWQVLQGCSRWEGLLDPIDYALKAEIIRYGEFAQATYDAFEGNRSSMNCGNSKYDEESLLESVGLENRGYEITNFLYATTNLRLLNLSDRRRSGSSSNESSVGDSKASSKQSNWIGFVAVCTSPAEILRLGRRDILIAWRGTQTINEWIADISDYMSPTGFGPDDDCSHIRVQGGFYNMYTSKNPRSQHNETTSARDQVMGAVKTLVEKYKDEGKLSITVTGHSLGSALATLCAYDIAVSNYNLLSDSPIAPQRWRSEESRSGTSSVRHSHIESVKNLIHSVRHHDKEDETGGEDDLIRHPHTASVRNFLHSKLHHKKADGNGSHRQRIIQGVRNLCGNEEEAEVSQFPPGKIPITVFSFAGPRVGNRNFRERIEELGVAVLRVVNVHDLVTQLPGLKYFSHVAEKLHHIIPHLPSYKHVGVKLEVDNLKSVFLRCPAGPAQAHCLEAYLHLVDAYRGRHKPYAGPHEKTFRDYALVNKSIDFLKPEFYIPPSWGNEKKEVARDSNGNWLFPGRMGASLHKPSNVKDEFIDFWQQVDDAAARSQAAMASHY